jgi:hypothetical protein
MTPLKYLLVIFVAASWFASAFLAYLLPIFSERLVWVSFACWVPLLFFSLSALFRCRWKMVAVFSATWVVAFLSLTRLESVERFRFWLLVQGFRIHVAPVERYLSRCELVAFAEDGMKQQLEECESANMSSYARDVVFYDTTGQIVLPPAQRTQGWKDAIYNFAPHCYLVETAVARHLFAKFYSVAIAIEHEDGC